jgi:hypothetical protein
LDPAGKYHANKATAAASGREGGEGEAAERVII